MSEQPVATTQRAYTLRLRGADKKDNSWRDALWATHEAVNKGAKVFGDWLLTLRGGLDHQLTDEKIPATKKEPERNPTNEERKDRRILLALSWLSVESAPKAGDLHETFIVASGKDDTQAARDTKVIGALRDILIKRGVTDDLEGWINDCSPSLEALIRPDAVWINRSNTFDEAVQNQHGEKAREDCRILLWWLFTKDYLALPRKPKPKKAIEQTIEDADDKAPEESRAAVVKSGKGASQRTRHPFSHLFGEGKPFGKPKQSLNLRDHWQKLLKPRVEASGIIFRLSKNEIDKTNASKNDRGRSQTELHREMLSKAAARLAQIWTKQKQQECDREDRKQADEALMLIEKQAESDPSLATALQLLNDFCVEQKDVLGSSNAFRITGRQIIGWDRVFARWNTIDESDPEKAEHARQEAAKALQDEDHDKKFGDINLYLRLAQERFKPVWYKDGRGEQKLLETYVKGMRARADAVRLKVASFRHPDPYINPIFCQFGNSRPAIEFRRLNTFTSDPAGRDARAVGMLLWDPSLNKADLRILHAVSSRFDREIGSVCDTAAPGATNLPEVTRRSRHGMAAAGLKAIGENPPAVAGVFDRKKVTKRVKEGDGSEDDSDSSIIEREPEWNGSLSAERRALAAIAKLVEKKVGLEIIRHRQRQLKWSLIVSIELQGQGPWHGYVTCASDQSPFERTVRKDEEKGYMRRKGIKYVSFDGWPFEEINKPLKQGKDGNFIDDKKGIREGHARLTLSRLPGLRVLSVDLGHRYAAACAVWQALSEENFAKECKEAKLKAGCEVTVNDLYAIIQGPLQESKKATKKAKSEGRGKFRPTTIFRRIGPNTLPNGQPHAAPWAKLKRQFLIKLPGEDQSPRAASDELEVNEMKLVSDFAARLGLIVDEERNTGRSVDELMSRAMRIATLGLKRHARRAKIAYAFDPNTKTIPGIGGSEKAFVPGDDAHIIFLADALFDWHSLAIESKWDDKTARDLWNQKIAPMPHGWRIEEPKRDTHAVDDRSRPQRRKDDDALCEMLKPLAKALAPSEQSAIYAAWRDHWKQEDGKHAIVPNIPKGQKGPAKTSVTSPASGWHAHLRWMTNWIMGKHLPGTKFDDWRRNVGGLSLTRIATMKSLYQLHKAFAMRAKPDKPRGAHPRKARPTSASLIPFSPPWSACAKTA